ncbi:EscN/YscN/HrcN family type III secretion system ATPase [Pseudomonas aeruginosa]|uniref:type III secretion system ATPase SctN n=1 Tax=Pseudomonas aeruginosa TaxID=287 RepID=UPI0009A83EEB|nr:type III secretion system ATPase SctN [Pseudomonas aeruginosa]OPL23839.1 EscN/YscN/HrcN family type III secretion system ATPase [Pseudomonas aeruginosa]
MPAPLSPLIVRMRHAIEGCRPIQIRGRVTQVTGTLLKAVVPGVRIGELCQLRNPDQNLALLAEVIGFQQHQALLTPLGEMLGVSSNTEVSPTGGMHRVAVGEHLLGQVLDGLGRPFDGSPPAEPAAWYPVYRDAPPPMSRRLIERPLSLGVRAIDGLLTCGEGQRMGIFAAAGGGKSTLLASLVRNAEVDVTVLALVGERGREVREFIESDLGEQGLRRSVLVVATSDRPAMERAKAGFVATSIAEYFRDKGKNVLLLMDSLTRYAQAQREIALAIGEPPATKGYPPSVFAKLPKLVERAGNAEAGGGSITAFYTVLSEGDDQQDPIADAARGVLDGHFVLSRRLAEEGHYPAIDIEASISRVMPQVVEAEHLRDAQRFKQLWSRYQQSRDLISVGAYVAGGDPETDLAIARFPVMRQFLRQGLDESESLAESRARLASLLAGGQA